MEATYYFKIYYNGNTVCTICAHTIYEAVDRTYSKYSGMYPEVDRRFFTARKIF
jgi:hypothetical protein